MSNLSRRRRAQGPFGDRFRMARKLGVMDTFEGGCGCDEDGPCATYGDPANPCFPPQRVPALRRVIRDRMRSLALRNDATWKETHP